MTVTNTSYITNQPAQTVTDWELWHYVEVDHIYDLLPKDTSARISIETPLSSYQLDRLYTALNWGKAMIIASLGERYDFSTITNANCGEIIKELNASLAQFRLESKRLRGLEKPSKEWSEFVSLFNDYSRENTVFKLDIPRKGTSITSGFVSGTTQFDNFGQFDNIIPSRDSDAGMVDGSDE